MACRCQVHESHLDCQAQPKRKYSEVKTSSKEEPQDKPNRAFALISSNIYDQKQSPRNTEKWIGDSGATVHITNDDKGMINIEECNLDITVGNDETVKCEKMGDIPLILKNAAGKTVTLTPFDIRYVPTFIGNLFSISTAMSNGAEINFKNKKMEA